MSKLDPQPSESLAAAQPGSWPSRWHFGLAALVFLALAAYGSFVPLQLQPMSLAGAVKRSVALAQQPRQTLSRTDLVTNVLLFVPIGFALLAALTLGEQRRGRIVAAAPLVLAACSLSSVLIEFAQNWFQRRTPSVLDIGAQLVGTLIGIAIWLVAGRGIVAWLRTHSASGGHEVVGGLLKLYLAGLLVYSLIPFNLSIHPRDLRDKYLRGDIVLRPFAEADGFSLLLDFISQAAAYVPVGMLTSIVFTTRARPLRPLVGSLTIGALLVIVLGGVQLLVVDRVFRTTDMISAMLGVIIGVTIVRRWIGTPATADDARENRVWTYFLFATLYAASLTAYFCSLPREGVPVITDGQQIERRLSGYFRAPFYQLYHGPIYNAAKEVVRKTGLLLPLGALLGLGVRALRAPQHIRPLAAGAALLATLALAVGIEMIQVFIPGHVPDLTDSLLYLAGATAGFVIGARQWLRRAAASSEHQPEASARPSPINREA